MKDNGRMIFKMARELKHGQMELNTRDSTKRERDMEKDLCNFRMVQNMRVRLRIMKLMDLDVIHGRMEKFTKDNG